MAKRRGKKKHWGENSTTRKTPGKETRKRGARGNAKKRGEIQTRKSGLKKLL